MKKFEELNKYPPESLMKTSNSGFLNTLLDLFESHEHIICWVVKNTSFVIKSVKKFTEILLPITFKHHNFDSFESTLKSFNFSRISGSIEQDSIIYSNKSQYLSNPEPIKPKVSFDKISKPHEQNPESSRDKPLGDLDKRKHYQYLVQQNATETHRIMIERNQIWSKFVKDIEVRDKKLERLIMEQNFLTKILNNNQPDDSAFKAEFLNALNNPNFSYIGNKQHRQNSPEGGDMDQLKKKLKRNLLEDSSPEKIHSRQNSVRSLKKGQTQAERLQKQRINKIIKQITLHRNKTAISTIKKHKHPRDGDNDDSFDSQNQSREQNNEVREVIVKPSNINKFKSIMKQASQQQNKKQKDFTITFGDDKKNDKKKKDENSEVHDGDLMLVEEIDSESDTKGNNLKKKRKKEKLPLPEIDIGSEQSEMDANSRGKHTDSSDAKQIIKMQQENENENSQVMVGELNSEPQNEKEIKLKDIYKKYGFRNPSKAAETNPQNKNQASNKNQKTYNLPNQPRIQNSSSEEIQNRVGFESVSAKIVQKIQNSKSQLKNMVKIEEPTHDIKRQVRQLQHRTDKSSFQGQESQEGSQIHIGSINSGEENLNENSYEGELVQIETLD